MSRAKYLSYDDGRREPSEISEVIGSIIENATVSVDLRHGELIDHWADVAPGDWALGTPIGVREGTLLVAVQDGATATLLRYQTTALLQALEARFGADLVAAVRVTVDTR